MSDNDNDRLDERIDKLERIKNKYSNTPSPYDLSQIGERLRTKRVGSRLKKANNE